MRRSIMSWLKWILAYLFDCVHSHTTWPHRDRIGLAYVCCIDCGRELPYSVQQMKIVTRQEQLQHLSQLLGRSKARAEERESQLLTNALWRRNRCKSGLSLSGLRTSNVVDASVARALSTDVALSKGSFSMSQSLTPASVAHTSATPHTTGTGAVRLWRPLNALIEDTSPPSRIEQGTRSWWRSRTAIIFLNTPARCNRLHLVRPSLTGDRLATAVAFRRSCESMVR